MADVAYPPKVHTTEKNVSNCQPSPTVPMIVSRKDDKQPLRIRGGCIPCGVRGCSLYFLILSKLNPRFLGWMLLLHSHSVLLIIQPITSKSSFLPFGIGLILYHSSVSPLSIFRL